jgi:hypothetical protein
MWGGRAQGTHRSNFAPRSSVQVDTERYQLKKEDEILWKGTYAGHERLEVSD